MKIRPLTKNPYAAGKVFSHNITKFIEILMAYLELMISHTIQYLYEGRLLTRKISGQLAEYLCLNRLTLGNLNATRDWVCWGYVEGMYLMMQHDTPEDWVLSTGESHSVKDFAEKAFAFVDLDWKDYVVTSEKYQRPNEVENLLGDSSKAKKILDWFPKTSFEELVQMMVEEDIKNAEKEKMLIKNNLLKPTWEYSK